MAVELVGICRHDRSWHWFCTFDFEVDRFYRFELREAGCGVIRFEPLLSMGQAGWLAERLNVSCRETVNLEKVRREFVQGGKVLGMAPAFISKLRLVRWANESIEKASTSSRAPLDDRVLDQLIRILAGRSLLSEEIMNLMDASGLGEWKADWRRYVQAGVCRGALTLVSGMEMKVRRSLWGNRVEVSCRRCGSSGSGLRYTECSDCGGLCPYCENCLTMGRVRWCSVLVRGTGIGLAETGATLGDVMPGAAWRRDEPMLQGFLGREGVEASETALAKEQQFKAGLSSWKLSPAQEAASLEGLRFLERTAHGGRGAFGGELTEAAALLPHDPPRFLIWAVTGAGKTEMIFPLVEFALKRGGKVLIATPRKDVVLELKPRISKAFEGVKVVALYGGSEDRWEPGDITLATTHQLMRFYRAFDLVIIDELDAFPYHNNPRLEYAAKQVCSPRGRYVLLSATPPVGLQREAALGKLPHVKVPVRYHRHPLPVPKRLSIPTLEQMVKRGGMPPGLMGALRQSVERGAQVFVFVPKIALVEPMVKLLRVRFPSNVVGGTSSQDENRGEKVTDFRGKEIQILVTTTILERGVTVPKSDVFILGADSSLFDEASLVQMAGRAGRSKDDPNGRVFFASGDWTKSQAAAIRQIRRMNKLAAVKGYLVEQGRKRSLFGGSFPKAERLASLWNLVVRKGGKS